MNKVESIKFIRDCIIKSHDKLTVDAKVINDLEEDYSIGYIMDFDNSILEKYINKKFSVSAETDNDYVIISWCDSILDIITNNHRLFESYLVSPN